MIIEQEVIVTTNEHYMIISFLYFMYKLQFIIFINV